MSRPIVDFGQSVRARLLSVAKVQGVQLEYVLLRYALERFLYRLGMSAHADRFVLKGASAFAVWIGPFCRVTRDADIEAFGDITPTGLLTAFREICSVACPEDAVKFDLESFQTEDIKKGDEYPGVRVSFKAMIGGARVVLQFDVGVGDSVFPVAERMDYPVLLGGKAPNIRVYPRYTVVAEKFQVMVSRGVFNSRIKDYYDLWLLTEHFDFDAGLLQTAIHRTFERRQTPLPVSLPEALTPKYAEDSARVIQWAAFLKRSGLDRSLSLLVVIQRLQMFLSPVWHEDSTAETWSMRTKCWIRGSGS